MKKRTRASAKTITAGKKAKPTKAVKTAKPVKAAKAIKAACLKPVPIESLRARLFAFRIAASKATTRKDLEEIEVDLSHFTRELEKQHLLDPLGQEVTLLRQQIFHRIMAKSAPATFF